MIINKANLKRNFKVNISLQKKILNNPILILIQIKLVYCISIQEPKYNNVLKKYSEHKNNLIKRDNWNNKMPIKLTKILNNPNLIEKNICIIDIEKEIPPWKIVVF